MSELILHIGAHKTATTALQNVLSRSEQLLAQADIIYPRISWFQFAQHRLAFGFKNITDPTSGDQPDPIEEIAGLNAVLAENPGKRILISSEELFSLSPASLTLLRTHLRAKKVRIIACVRRPDEMLLSIYNQKAKTPGNNFSFPLVQFLERPRAIDPDIAYGQQLGKWMDHFPDARFSVFTYEEDKPLNSFFSLLGLPAPAPLHAGGVINPSVPAPVVQIMCLAKSQGFDPGMQRRLWDLATRHFAQAPRLSLNHDRRRRILEILEDEYNAIFARLGRKNPYPPSILGPRPQGALPAIPTLTAQDMIGLIRELMKD